MNLRTALVLAGSLVFAGGCASGGSVASDVPAVPSSGGATLAQGERPRENDMTRAAEEHIEQAEAAATPAEAKGHYELAVSSAQQAADADPTNPLPYLQLGIAYIGLDDMVAADQALTRAEELRPIYQLQTEGIRERAWIDMYQRAAPAVNAGDYEEAVRQFELADAIFDARPEVKAYLGQLYVQLAEYEKGLVALRAAQSIINSDRITEVDSVTAAGWRETDQQLPIFVTQALISLNRYDEAAQELQRILADDPNNLVYLRQLASLYVEMDQPDDAKAIYERMAATGNLSSVDYYAIGVGYYQMDDFPAAIASFKRAAEVSKNNRDALEMWARTVQLAYGPGENDTPPPPGVLEEMLGGAERWWALDPNNQNAALIVAQTANRLGDEDRAREMIAAVEALEVRVNNVEFQRYPDGGGIISGSVVNVSKPAGSSVTLVFSFYNAQGAEVATERTTVQLPAPEASQVFQIDVQTSAPVDGYGYKVEG